MVVEKKIQNIGEKQGNQNKKLKKKKETGKSKVVDSEDK